MESHDLEETNQLNARSVWIPWIEMVESCAPFFHSKGRERIINHFVISKVELLNEIGILEYEEIIFFS